MYYLAFLEAMHIRLVPRTYLEIGVAAGKSLRLARCRSVGIDPAYAITVPIDGDIALFRTSSDEYFSRPDPLEPTDGRPFDLVFIDGLHLFEFALRDFINAERNCTPASLIVFDDVLPRTVDEAARERHTSAWTGDVYSILDVLARFRPEVIVIPVDTSPTGLLLVFNLDPHSKVLADNYERILAEYRRPDPQPVPSELMDRLVALPAHRVLESGVWELMRTARTSGDDEELRRNLAEEVARALGPAFATTAGAGSAP